MGVLKQYRTIGLVLLVSAFFWVLLGYESVILFLSVLLTYRILDTKLSTTIFSSKVYRLVISIILYVAALQATILFVWLFDNNFP